MTVVILATTAPSVFLNAYVLVNGSLPYCLTPLSISGKFVVHMAIVAAASLVKPSWSSVTERVIVKGIVLSRSIKGKENF
jgi:hypothetical protein